MFRLANIIVLIICTWFALSQTAWATRYVIYYKSDASPASAVIGLPYTHVILSFVTARGAADGAVRLSTPDRLQPALLETHKLKADGKKVLISFGGGDMPAAAYQSLVGREKALAAALAGFVRKHGLDGVDIDFEISAALSPLAAERPFRGKRFLVQLTKELRALLPRDALLTHVPQAPYLDPDWHGEPYLEVLREVGRHIDWITVQYYNNPGFDNPTGIDADGQGRPSSFAGIVNGANKLNWPAHKTLIGKPIFHHDASTGYMSPARLKADIVEPLVKKYGSAFGGLTGWQFSTLTADHRYWNRQMAPALKLSEDNRP